MKKIISISIALIFSLSLFSQVVDKQAEKILEEVSKKMQSFNAMQIDFTYLMENTKEKIKESKTGTILIQGDKYRLSIDDQLIISDGKSIWTYMKSANEVQINEVDSEDELNPVKMLTGYNKNFNPKFIREMAKQGKTIQIIDLTPKKTQSFYKVRIEIDKTRKTMVSSAIFEKSGNTFTYSINKLVENPTVNANSFIFNSKDYPRITVTDMR